MSAKGFAAVLLVLAVVAGGCQRPTQPVSFYSSALQVDALKTCLAVGKNGDVRFKEDIPSVYWAERIKALRPLNVYSHRSNIVVVQKLTGAREEGLYINLPISSYVPEAHVDGFEFVPDAASAKAYGYTDGHDVWHYTRNSAP